MAGSHQEAWQNNGTAGYGVSVVRFPTAAAGDRPHLERATPPDAAFSNEVMELKLKSIINHRRSRLNHFPRELFADPAWDILLDLALAELQQRRVSISSLCLAAQVPSTTGLRWIKHLTHDGWLIRSDDPLDARRTFISLTGQASQKMRDCIAGLDENFSA